MLKDGRNSLNTQKSDVHILMWIYTILYWDGENLNSDI